MSDQPTPRILVDPSTGRPVLMAPRRQVRPHNTGPGDAGTACPFCPSHEADTPPELDAIRAPGTAKDQPGWTMRSFANLYPATDHHEVVAEGAEHHTQPVHLDSGLWTQALTLYQRRIRTLEARPGVRTAYWFKNVGAAAGASMAHNHSQILGLPMLPPRLVLEDEQNRRHGHCVHCAEIAAAETDGRLVWRGPHHLILIPSVPKLPHETWLLPLAHTSDFLAEDPAELATALHTLFCRIARAFREPPFNLYLHRIPGGDFHWHWELQPRTGQVAGLELGGDMYINSVLPQQSAARLRG